MNTYAPLGVGDARDTKAWNRVTVRNKGWSAPARKYPPFGASIPVLPLSTAAPEGAALGGPSLDPVAVRVLDPTRRLGYIQGARAGLEWSKQDVLDPP
jgi:hypothetical protein